MANMKPMIGTMEPFHSLSDMSDNAIIYTEYYVVHQIDKPIERCKKVQYTYNCKDLKENPQQIVKWCRKNFGERGVGWDFYLVSGNVIIEVWYSRFCTMYEMWKK
jgi:hypothetical protein